MSGIYRITNHPLWGTHHSNETKQKIRVKHLGKIVSDETQEKIRRTALQQPRGRQRWNFGGIYVFQHPSYGEETIGQCELVQKYNRIPLDKSAINKLCSSKLKQYKGWTCKGKAT